MNRDQAFLVALLVIVTASVVFVVEPFVEYILAATIFAYILYPVHTRLTRVLEGIRFTPRVAGSVSAVLLTIGGVIIVVLPFLIIVSALIRDLRALSRGDIQLQLGLIETWLAETTGLDLDVGELLMVLSEWLLEVLFGGLPGLVSVMLEVTVGIALVLFLVFYLLRDGSDLVRWLADTSPLSSGASGMLLERVDRTAWGSVIGHAFAAVVQALVAGIGLYLVGIPNVVFWTFVMVILAFLPLIGVFLVWAPAAGYLYVIGETLPALLLVVYALTVVSMIDYYVRPIVVDQSARLNPAVILVGVFGGVFTLGFVGLFIGPILIGVLVAILETFRTEFGWTGPGTESTAG